MSCFPADTRRSPSSFLDSCKQSTDMHSVVATVAHHPMNDSKSVDYMQQGESPQSCPGTVWLPRVPSEAVTTPVEPENSKYYNAADVARQLQPSLPITLTRPHCAANAARFFSTRFPGTPMYAVKANASAEIIKVLYSNGIRQFDVASINEVRLVASAAPHATMCFMHPIKAFESIREAYFSHGVRTFSLDSLEEVDKIVKATQGARDLTLCVRIRVSSEYSKLSLGSKFGTFGEEAVAVLQAVRSTAARTGICFHVGSQNMDPCAYVDAMEVVRALVCASGVVPDVIDVGGGFPSVYPNMTPPPMQTYFDTIKQAFDSLHLPASTVLWAEPGRALCNEYSSVLVRVEHKRNGQLYINDGAYGTLFDAAHLNWLFPTRLLRDSVAPKEPYSMWGPTCDDMDFMQGPFPLPSDICTGDFVEVGMIGSYGSSMRTGFNGFVNGGTVDVCDPPMASMYHDDAARLALDELS